MDLAALLTFAAPVAIASVGESICQKSGVINIGLEGSILSAAFLGYWSAYSSHNVWLGLFCGILGGVGMSLLGGVFSVLLSTDQVVVGTAINLLALGVTGTLYRTIFGVTGTLATSPMLPKWRGIDPLLPIILVAAWLATFVLNRTSWGLATRAAGEKPEALEAAGFSSAALRMQGLAISGLGGGIAGTYLTLAYTGSFAENMSGGRGFIAIAMVTFGKWKPLQALGAALLIGFAGSLQYWLQSQNSTVPYQFFEALPYVVALIFLILVGKKSDAPGALGQTYRREK